MFRYYNETIAKIKIKKLAISREDYPYKIK